MAYEAVGFDYGGVISGQPGTVHAKAIRDAIGVDRQTYSEAFHRHNKKVNRDEITWEELHRLVLADLGKPEKLDAVLRIDAEFFGKATVNEPVIEIIDRLRSQGYKTGLLSNNSATLSEEIKRNGVISHFDVINISAITGLVKPDPETFAHFMNELDVKPEELVYTDDSRNSLSTAAECGYTPILFESPDQLTVELAKLGLLP